MSDHAGVDAGRSVQETGEAARRGMPAVVAGLAAPAIGAALLTLAGVAFDARGGAAAEAWSRAFASETTRTVFLTGAGALVRARFDLSEPETLWHARSDERVARIRVSPDGARVVWTTRSTLHDSTRLWLDGAPRRAMAFRAVRPIEYGVTRYEPETPSLRDAVIHGARLVRPGLTANRPSTNVLDWSPDGRRPVVADTLGLAVYDPVRDSVARVAPGLATRLRALEPAPVYLASVIVADSRRERRESSVLVYPAADRWRMYPLESFGFHHRWTGSETGTWWADGRRAYEVRASDPRRRILAEERAPIVWLGYDRSRRQVVWGSDRTLRAGPDDGGPDTTLLTLPERIVDALTTADGQTVVLRAEASAHVVDLASREVRAVSLAGARVDTLLRAPAGALVFGSRGARSARAELFALDAGATALRPLGGPRLDSAEIAASPSGRFVLLHVARSTPPTSLHAFDTVEQRWIEVAVPDLAGWEPLLPAP